MEENNSQEIITFDNNAGLTSDGKVKRRSILIAVFLNFLSPGLGVYYSGKFIRGVLIALCWPIIVGLFLSFILKFPSLASQFFICFILNIIYVTLLIYTIYSAYKNEKEYVVLRWNNPAFYIIFFIFFAIYSKPVANIFVEAYRIPTGSMEKTLVVEDFILVNKNIYGITLPFSNFKILSLESPKRNDVVIYFPNKKDKELYIKRIVGIPGDTIEIEHKKVFINGNREKPNNHFTFDDVQRDKDYMNPRMYPKDQKWNEDNYGPLYIPKKGDVIKLDSVNVNKWGELIAKDSDEPDLKFPMKLLAIKEYVIQNNYYFMMGDSRNNSLDSRYTGLVPESDIIGKAGFIYFNKKDFSRI